MRPTSRGQLRLKSADPREYILMDPNYLSTPEDREDFRLAVKHTRELFTMQVRSVEPGSVNLKLPLCTENRQQGIPIVTRFSV